VRVAVTGATGVIGRSAVPALIAAGHDVVGLARTDAKAAWLESVGAKPASADIFSVEDLTAVFTGCDAVINLATSIPSGYAAALPRRWRANDRLRTEGSRCVLEAARTAGVRRVLQESISFLYADGGDDWITESSPIDITAATEPASVAESQMQDFQCCSRTSVVLRFGNIVGDDPMTEWRLRGARQGRPIGMGSPDGWAHVIHTDDLGPAVVAALEVTSGIYNVGAEPVLRRDLVQGFANAAERLTAEFMGPVMRRLAGPRAEPLTRSLRVSSQALTDATGWTPLRPTFDAAWLEAVAPVPS
jgi:nucleoside-diphosphate-sugar epimerase